MDVQRSVRIAAVADIHARNVINPSIEEAIRAASATADVLLLPGDISQTGLVSQLELYGPLWKSLEIPILAVWGNHDRRNLRRTAMRSALGEHGVTLLDGTSEIIETKSGIRLGIVGFTGSGGGFREAVDENGTGRRLTYAVELNARRIAAQVRSELSDLAREKPDIALMTTHFSPTPTTLEGEPPVKYWMLGNALLGDAIDEFPIDVVIHGHAHAGTEVGETSAGIPVRNVSLPVNDAVMVYAVAPGRSVSDGERFAVQHDVAHESDADDDETPES